MLPFAMEWSDGPVRLVSVCCSRDVAELMSINGLTALLCYPVWQSTISSTQSSHACSMLTFFSIDSDQAVVSSTAVNGAAPRARLPTAELAPTRPAAGVQRCAASSPGTHLWFLPRAVHPEKTAAQRNMHEAAQIMERGTAAIGGARRSTYSKQPLLTEAPRRACPSRAARGTFKSTRSSLLGCNP